MGWALSYRITLSRPLTRDETAALRELSQQHRYSLVRPARGLDWLEAWKEAITPAELERLRSLEANRPRSASDAADFADHLQVRRHKQLLAIVRWLQAVEAQVPFDEFVVRDDYVLVEPIRPSLVDLSALERLAALERQNRKRSPRAEQQAVMAAARDLMESTEREFEPLEKLLSQARADFERWKRRSGR